VFAGVVHRVDPTGSGAGAADRAAGREVGEAAADRFSCVLAAAGHYRVSWPIAQAALADHIVGPLAEPLPVVSVLGIDETRRGKPVWAQDPVTGRWQVVHDRWHTGIVDAVGTAGLLAHVEGRTSTAVIGWLDAQPQACATR